MLSDCLMTTYVSEDASGWCNRLLFVPECEYYLCYARGMALDFISPEPILYLNHDPASNYIFDIPKISHFTFK